MPLFTITIKGRFPAYSEDDAINTIEDHLENIGFTVVKIESDSITQTKLKQEVKN